MTLFEKYRKAYEQCFIPIFVKDSFDTDTLIEGCKLAGAEVIEYTLRREDANTVIPNLKEDFGGVVFVGSTIDDDRITLQMKKKNPQLMTLSELACTLTALCQCFPIRMRHLINTAARTYLYRQRKRAERHYAR